MEYIFISAYACAPSGVSELSVGWNFIKNIANNTQKYKLIIVTQENDVRLNVKKDIENFLNENKDITNLEFYYLDVPIIKNSKIRNLPGFHYIYYYIWQVLLYRKYKKLEKNYNFKLVHHLTFVTINQPTFLYKANKPFIWGPLGGAEIIPESLYKNVRFKDKVKEKIRTVLVKLRKYSYNIKKCIEASEYIVCVNNDTGRFIGVENNSKIKLIPAIGYDLIEKTSVEYKGNTKINIITVGLVYYRKGIDICIDVAKQLKVMNIDFEWKVIGRPFNDEIINYKNILVENKLEENFIFQHESPHEFVMQEIRKSDVMVFLSRKDSGGFVVLEALQNNVPVITFDIGGPSEVVKLDKSFGWNIDVSCDYSKIINEIVKIITNNNFALKKNEICENIHKLDYLYKWEEKANEIINLYDKC